MFVIFSPNLPLRRKYLNKYLLNDHEIFRDCCSCINEGNLLESIHSHLFSNFYGYTFLTGFTNFGFSHFKCCYEKKFIL